MGHHAVVRSSCFDSANRHTKVQRRKEGRKKMGAFEDQVKMRAIELKLLFKKGIKVVGKSCKKGWSKVKNLRR
ncbi:unnamed protein product [Brassica rapa subsp. trilocularis]